METPLLAQVLALYSWALWLTWLSWLLLALMGFSIGYWLFSTMLLWHRQRSAHRGAQGDPDSDASSAPGVSGSGFLPPIAFLRPVKRGVPQLADKAGRLVAAARPGDWVVFAVGTPEDEAACRAACRQACEGVTAEVVFCGFAYRASHSSQPNCSAEEKPACELIAPGGGWNPKIAKLIALTSFMGSDAPEHWIVSDCEAIPEIGFMDRFREEWAALERRNPAAILTAGYHFAGAKRFFQQLDHFPSLLTLWPGLVVSEWGGRHHQPPIEHGLGFTLGACTGLRKRDLQQLGGWEAFLSYLAEDHRLGAELAKAGHPTFLSHEVLRLDSDPLGWVDWLRHQHRVSFTYRVCNPAGFLGMGLIQGVMAGCVLVLLHPAVVWSWAALALLLLVRMITANVIAASLGCEIQRPIAFSFMSLLAAFVESGFWAAAWLPLPVRWGSQTLKVGRDGQFSGSKADFEQSSLASEGSFNYQSDS